MGRVRGRVQILKERVRFKVEVRVNVRVLTFKINGSCNFQIGVPSFNGVFRGIFQKLIPFFKSWKELEMTTSG